ncbi:MAG TPA: AAA family ATPase, partial [Chloroflexota bacterium]|nr:AAA family ATPase [Chloroflexota bacterium]
MATTAVPTQRSSPFEDLLFRAALCLAGAAVAIFLWPLTLCGGVLWLLWHIGPASMRPPRLAAFLVGAVCLTAAVWVFRLEGLPLDGGVEVATDWLVERYLQPSRTAFDALLPIVLSWLASGTVSLPTAIPGAVLRDYAAGVWPFGLVGAGCAGFGAGFGAFTPLEGGKSANSSQIQHNDASYRPKAERADREARKTGGGTQWVVYGLVGRQCLTIISGPYKGGKSTLVCALIRAMLTGQNVLGLAAQKAKRVRWFTEESPGSMRQKLRQWGLSDKRLTIIYRGQSGAASWASILGFLERDARDGEVVVVDTLAVHVSNQPGAENSTDVMTAAMEAARSVAQRKGVAVVFVHH